MPLARHTFASLVTAVAVGMPTVAVAQQYCPPCQPQPQWQCPPAPRDQWQPAPGTEEPAPAPPLDSTQPSQPQPQAPAQPQPQQPAPQAQPTFTPSAPSTAATSPQALSPNMIGDFFGTGQSQFFLLGSPYSGPSPASAGGNVGRQKLSENTSPIPRDRVFVNYSLFETVNINAGGATVSRFTPGVEKTFADGNLSVEFRVPFATTVDNDFFSDGSSDTGNWEWGDLTLFLKALLYNNDCFALAGGIGFSFPTHDPFTVFNVGDPNPVIKVDNNGYHALPYIAGVWTPNDRLFAQAYLQVDVDLNGNSVYFGDTNVGRLDDTTYLFVDLGVGYWVYQDLCSESCIRGIAPVVELHFNRGLEENDVVVDAGGTQVGNAQEIGLTNLVLGVNTLIGDSSTLTLGYGVPLGGDEQFDGEFRLVYNWLFGGSSRQSSVQFAGR